ncbi:unnamed protein product [Pleuronectes platessa]|uniref:Uncharacterized protein n=1 Tax=Pleuronectes platessa TaxID=8262 RepID=A0A9N7UV24_PLEPL|nr:unnamed protein product [Pleuronectes platessa]
MPLRPSSHMYTNIASKENKGVRLGCRVVPLEPLCSVPSWNPPSHARLKPNLVCGDVMKYVMGVLEKVDPLASEQRPWAFEKSKHMSGGNAVQEREQGGEASTLRPCPDRASSGNVQLQAGWQRRAPFCVFLVVLPLHMLSCRLECPRVTAGPDSHEEDPLQKHRKLCCENSGWWYTLQHLSREPESCCGRSQG